MAQLKYIEYANIQTHFGGVYSKLLLLLLPKILLGAGVASVGIAY